MTSLVLIKKQNNQEIPVTTSKLIAEMTNNKHHSITKLVQTYEKDFSELGILRFEIEEIKGKGQPEKLYFLNEQQATLLITYLRNSEIVRAFKVELVKQFYAMREMLQQKQTQQWQEARLTGKLEYRDLTDTIKVYIEYATEQGSKSANKYYTHFAKLTNSVVGIEDGQRGMATSRVLTVQTFVMDLIKRTIEEEMAMNTPYKAIYQICKQKVNELVGYLVVKQIGA